MALTPSTPLEVRNGESAADQGRSTRKILLLVFAVFFILGGVTNITTSSSPS